MPILAGDYSFRSYRRIVTVVGVTTHFLAVRDLARDKAITSRPVISRLDTSCKLAGAEPARPTAELRSLTEFAGSVEEGTPCH